MRSTIRDVAEQAGVSTATVSLVLRGIDGRTAPETRERVLQAAQRLNYLPVKPPTSQNRPLETNIVTLVPEHRDMENHDLDMFTYQGIISVARNHSYDVLTLVGQENKGVEPLKSRYLDRRSDGFIFAISHEGPWEKALQIVSEYEIPAVACYRQHAPEGVATVAADNAGAMRQAVEILARNGHQSIAYLSGPPNNFDEQARRSAWIEAMRWHGLEHTERVVLEGAGIGYVPNDEEMARVSQLGVTAVVCFNDTIALRLWDILESQGVSVPQDISILGMDDHQLAAPRGLSTFAHSFMDVGKLAMEAWLKLKNGGDAATCSQLAPVNYIPRASVRRLRKAVACY